MHIALAPFRLKPGISEEALLAASNDFEVQFVQKQNGILKRPLVTDGEGGYADIVFFHDAAAIDRVLEAERDSDACAAFFGIMQDDGTHRVFEVLHSYQ